MSRSILVFTPPSLAGFGCPVALQGRTLPGAIASKKSNKLTLVNGQRNTTEAQDYAPILDFDIIQLQQRYFNLSYAVAPLDSPR